MLAWLHVLPNIKYLAFGLQDARYWLSLDTTKENLTFFLNRIEQLVVDCSTITDSNFSNEMNERFLPFFTDCDIFSHLRCMRLSNCANNSAIWATIRQWIDIILTSGIRHQLRSLRFDFTDEEYYLVELEMNDALFVAYELDLHANIHRRAWPGHVELWIEKK